MFPISSDTLSFAKIARYWSREIHPPASFWELLETLEAAWWCGDIVGTADFTRLDVLPLLFRRCQDRVVFLVDNQSAVPEARSDDLAEGEVDFTPRVPVPSTDTEWDDENCKLTYRALAEASAVFANDPTVGPTLGGINSTHQEFIEWLSRCGYAPVTFWAASKSGSPSRRSSQDPAPLAPTSGLAKAKVRTGRKPKFDWIKIEQIVFGLLTRNGHWDSEPEDGWRSQNDLIVALQARLQLDYSKGGPANSTIKERLPAMIAEWRKRSVGI
jgi:hypothetical protein